MNPINKHQIPFYQHKSPENLREGIKYNFGIRYAKYLENSNTLQLVFILHDAETSKGYYLLEDFEVGKDRYEAIVRRAYANEDVYNCVIDVTPEDFERFSGECSLIKTGDELHIDLNSIKVNSTPCSSIWHNQAILFDFFEDPSVEEVISEDEFVHKSNTESVFYVQPILPNELQTGHYYDFTVKRAHAKADGTLQVVFELCDDNKNCYWLLEEFTPDSPRFNAFFSEAYSVPVDYGTVIEVVPEDICGTFSGSCELEEYSGRLRINWSSIQLSETLLSPIFDEQLAAQKGGVA